MRRTSGWLALSVFRSIFYREVCSHSRTKKCRGLRPFIIQKKSKVSALVLAEVYCRNETEELLNAQERSKGNLRGQVKSGQRGSCQNRPTDLARDSVLLA